MSKFTRVMFTIVGASTLSAVISCSDEAREYPAKEQGLSYMTDAEVRDPDMERLPAGSTRDGLSNSALKEPAYAPETVRSVDLEGGSEGHVGTVRFEGESTELTDLAEESLDELLSAIDKDEPAHIVVRTVNPNNANPDQPDPLAEARAATVKEFIEEKGLNVAAWQMGEVTEREYGQMHQGDADMHPVHDAENAPDDVQRVVITIVSVNESGS